MRKPLEPLSYPPGYPPTDRWKKFFIGVRRLGPDLSFFADLEKQQQSRTEEMMSAWGGGQRQDLATGVGRVFQKWLRWPTPYFLPDDSIMVIAGGPRFHMVDNLEFEAAIEEIETHLARQIP